MKKADSTALFSARMLEKLPLPVRNSLDRYGEWLGLAREVETVAVAKSLAPSSLRGLILRRGKQGVPTEFQASHRASIDWSCPSDQPEMAELYARAKRGQWDGDSLPWHTSVDLDDPNLHLLPIDGLDIGVLERNGVKLNAKEIQKLTQSMAAWMLSQFLHGEQGALMAAAQVTECVPFFDGKLYGATQVVDEGRHVEVFRRYLDEKLEKTYQINDNLFVIIDALMRDARWDMKFLGMQIMVEGLALGAFSIMYKMTAEPLLKTLLKYVIQDEARHVHYGVVALREHIKELSERERREREQWTFEVALLMRNRFMAYEVYEEWFEGRMPRAAWREMIESSPAMREFRQVMFSRLMPNLREIGLMSPKVTADYDRVGLLKYASGASASQLTGEAMVAALEQSPRWSASAA
ncbi:MAG TPA: ferritin-like domain-containing protein [Kofleriaceae bacterium]|nr:ferritin-like domain-containing protein [Kofleriaceae bacterium]